MRMFSTVVALVLATSTAGFAQDMPVAGRRNLAVPAAEIRPEAKVVDKTFLVVAGALNSAMLLDTNSTFTVSRVCTDCHEANPFVAPFVRRGPVTTYVAGELFDAGVMTMAAKMKGADRRWVRRTWWVLPVALAAGHTIAYRHNVALVK